jgi:hypothetical protein
MVNAALTTIPVPVRRGLDVAATILSFGTNKLIGRAGTWLHRRGMTKFILPMLLMNEGFGAYRVYLAGGMSGWW